MARFILLHFKDDNESELFVSSIREDAAGRVVGIYQDPRHKPCSCNQASGHNVRGWGIHPKYGWWVHQICGRVGELYRASYGRRLHGALGKNLLPVEKTPNSLRNPQDMVTKRK